jgi:hypothetical protein
VDIDFDTIPTYEVRGAKPAQQADGDISPA